MGLAAACLLAAGCVSEQTLKHERGTAIRFGASTTWENGSRTRTDYSGYDESGDLVHKGSEYERIDWVAGKDQVKILCKAAGGSAVYQVNGADANGQKSEATSIDATDGTLVWGEGEHVFFASYPVAGMLSPIDEFGAVDGADASISPVGTDGNAAQVFGRVPYLQQVHRVNGTAMTEFKPNMNYAHMYAQTTADPATDDGVLLQFHPLVTTFEITLVSIESDPIAAPLMKARLVSANNDLAGSFTADLAKGATPVISELATSEFKKKTVTIDFGEGGVTLSDTKPIKFTFLTLPLDQSQIKLELLFDGGITKSLDLKYAADSDGVKDDWIEVGACKKVYLSNVAVSKEWTYFIDNLSCEEESGIGIIYVEAAATVDADETVHVQPGSAPVQFDTYKKNESGEKVYVPIGKVEYSADGVSGWTTTLPTTTFTADFDPDRMTTTGIRDKATAAMTGFDPIEKETVTVDAATRHTQILRGRTPVGSDSAPRDLSLYTVEGKARTGDKRVTANCYVVNGGGWYKFPLVYGNAIDQERIAGKGVNEQAYHPGALSSESRFLQTFQNYLGAGITSPYILTDTGVSISDVEAVVVWSDAGPSALESVEQITNDNVSVLDEDHGYIRFFIDKTKIHQGNIVIALRKKESVDPAKTILWSWHIWVSDLAMTPVRMSAVNERVPGETAARPYTDFMQHNLGACEEGTMTIISYNRAPYYVRVTQQDASGYHVSQVFKIIERGGTELHATISSGTYYQYGRKDAFLPSSGEVETAIVRVDNPVSSTNNKAFYSPSGYQIPHTSSPSPTVPSYDFADKALNYQEPTVSHMGESIQNPYVVYHKYGHWKLESNSEYNLWDSHMTSGNKDQIPVKTVYDPCPPGFVVPNLNAFLNFNGKGDYTVELTEDGKVYDGFSGFNVIDLNGDGIISDKDFERGFYFRKEGSNLVEKITDGDNVTFNFIDILSGRGNGLFFPATGYRLCGEFTSDTSLESDVYEMGLEGWYWTTASYAGEGLEFLFTTHLVHAGSHGKKTQGFNMQYMNLKSSLCLTIRAMVDEIPHP